MICGLYLCTFINDRLIGEAARQGYILQRSPQKQFGTVYLYRQCCLQIAGFFNYAAFRFLLGLFVGILISIGYRRLFFFFLDGYGFAGSRRTNGIAIPVYDITAGDLDRCITGCLRRKTHGDAQIGLAGRTGLQYNGTAAAGNIGFAVAAGTCKFQFCGIIGYIRLYAGNICISAAERERYFYGASDGYRGFAQADTCTACRFCRERKHQYDKHCQQKCQLFKCRFHILTFLSSLRNIGNIQ